jgi:hypothetical protein
MAKPKQEYRDEQVRDALVALELNQGNLKATALQLGMPRTTLLAWRDRALAVSDIVSNASDTPTTGMDTDDAPALLVAADAPAPVRDFAALWADAQALVLSQTLAMAGQLTEPTAENLTALTKLLTVSADQHLNYTQGRKGGVQIGATGPVQVNFNL